MGKVSEYNQMLELIGGEDEKNPLTDQELSELLRVSRSSITTMRKAAGIANSRERREPVLRADIGHILAEEPGANMNRIAARLGELGYRISLNSVARGVREAVPDRAEPLPAPAEPPPAAVEGGGGRDAFASIIGGHRSLNMQIEQAKAAVLYPTNGLHTLIIGETGVGKSALAEAMYDFALASRGVSAVKLPFVVLNCADYAENPQLLTAQLFGCKKGAFTGAKEDRDGLISQADGGVFFLDEVHRLPPDGQEMLFQLIDKGVYRRLGDNRVRRAQVMIIAATTENVETSLLDTFRRRIPMVISIPSLEERGMDEKFDIVASFFCQEAMRINREILVTADALFRLLAKRYDGNIGELRSKIQVACAKGYLACMHQTEEDGRIVVDAQALMFPPVETPGDPDLAREVARYTSRDLVVYPTNRPRIPGLKVKDPYEFSDELYRIVETEYQKRRGDNMSRQEMDAVIWTLMEKKIARYISQMRADRSVRQAAENIQGLFDGRIVSMVEEMLALAARDLGEVDDSLLFCLTAHFNASVQRLRDGDRILNPNLDNVKQEYATEFDVARRMAELTVPHLGLELPEEEIGFIAMYLAATRPGADKAGEAIALIVVTHGRVAAEMAAVVERLMGGSHVLPLCINLDESTGRVYERLKELVLKADRGRGVLVLVDMGSPESFGAKIAEETGVEVRTVTRVDTLMVLDAVRKVQLLDADLDEVAESLAEQRQSVLLGGREGPMGRKMAFVFYCLTGKGCAAYLFDRLWARIRTVEPEVEFEVVDALSSMDMDKQISRLKKRYHLIGAAGSFRIGVPDVPLLLMSQVQDTEAVDRFMQEVDRRRQKVLDEQERAARRLLLFEEELIFLDSAIGEKEEAIRFLGMKLLRRGVVTGEFLDSALEREGLVPTGLQHGVAIPHGYCAEVIKPRIAVLIPRTPIPWGNGTDARLILLLAFTEETNSAFGRIYNIISDRDMVDKIVSCRDRERILRYFGSGGYRV